MGGGQVTVDGGQTLTWDAVTLDNVTLSGSFSNAAGPNDRGHGYPQ